MKKLMPLHPFRLACFILLSVLLAGCHKDKTTTVDKAFPAISAFIFEMQYNPLLTEDYHLVVASTTIDGTVIPTAPKKLIASFVTDAKEVYVNNVQQQSHVTVVDFTNPVIYTLVSADGLKKEFTIRVNWNYKIPHIYITTTSNTPIVSKTDYVQAAVVIEGNGGYNDYTGTTNIRGRGNSTWDMPKKPYRLKLDKKATLFGLAESKNWVLLANYLDGTLMLNSVAMKTGQLLEMPYTNHMIPVDVTINNTYAGSYMFTEQVEVATNRVPVENGGLLLELDQNFDEPWQFKSYNYDLPVMVKYPDLASAADLEPIKTAFHDLENLVAAPSFPNNNYADYIDTGSLVNYFIVHMLTDNEEINHPKSTYLYKPQNGKFFMGPIWDFDWAFGYEGTFEYFRNFNMSLFWPSRPEPGNKFFSRFLIDPAIKVLFKHKWAAFKTGKLPALLQHVTDYANLVESSRNADFQVWHTGSGNFRTDVSLLYTWLQNRAAFIDSYAAGL